MSDYAPQYRHGGSGRSSPNPYENRWRPWYPAVSDWIVRNPSGTQKQMAAELGKSVHTISAIMQTDIFKEFHAQRMAEWRQRHDDAVRHRLLSIADQSLDILAEQMEKKRDQIPMAMVQEVAMSALDRLGYSPQSAAVQVNVDNRNQSVVIQGVSATELEEARMAMRLAEAANRGSSLAVPRHRGAYDIEPKPVVDLLDGLGFNPPTDVPVDDSVSPSDDQAAVGGEGMPE